MRKILPFILIAIIFAQMLLPFSIGSGVKNNLEVRVSKAEAAIEYYYVKTATTTQVGYPSGKFTGGTDTENKTKCENDRLIVYPGFINGPCLEVTATQASTLKVDPNNNPTDSNLACVTGFLNIHVGACIAQGLYWIFFKPTSVLFALAGKIMDVTLKYTLSDTSYRSAFVVEGWGTIRDFVNMFFIFVLLYIAIGTILNLNGVKTKEMIINVVIIGLLINFSLFATQVIIDASNILARVFYNPQTIVITQKDASGNPVATAISGTGKFDEIRLSEAIVSKVDPHDIVLQSDNIGKIDTKSIPGGGADTPSTTTGEMSVGTFILIVFLSTAVNIVGMLVFLSCAFVFVGRVVMLWVAMILAPLAFFSYTVPQLQAVKMIGWKNWWSSTLSMAFVAPVFAFFMYIIVGFMDKGLNIVNAAFKLSATGLNSVVAIVVPFIFIMVLLLQAKKLAVSMSGDVGAALSKAGSAVGGAVVGAGIGALAMAGRKTVGWAGNKLDKSGGVNDWAGSNNKFKSFIGNKLKDTGQSVGKRSFDVRATGLGAAAGAAIGANIGKAKEGGYIKDREDKVKRKQKRAQDLEVNEDEGLKRNLNREEINLQVILNAVAPDLGRIDREIEVKKKGRKDLVQGSEEDKKVAGEIADLKKQRNAITTAKGSDAVTARTKVSTIQTNLDTARTTATTDIATAKSNKVTEEAKASANTANAKAEAPKNILAAETEEKAAKDKHSTVKMEADTARTTASNATASANANPANQSLQVAAENARTKSAEAEAKLLAAATKLEEAGAKVVSAKNAVSEAEKNEETVKATHESIVSDAEGKVVNLEKNLANAKAVATAAETSAKSGGRSIHQREVEDIPEARNKMETKSRARTTGFANSNAWLGTSTGLEVQHKIIMGNKIDSGEKTH